VVQVGNGEHQALLIANFQQDSKERDRVCPSGDGHADAVSGREKGMLQNVTDHGSAKRMHMVMVHRWGKRTSFA